MILASILLLFSLLALGLLALLDRYDTAMIKSQAASRMQLVPQKVVYYDAFADRRQQPRGTPPQGHSDRRESAA